MSKKKSRKSGKKNRKVRYVEVAKPQSSMTDTLRSVLPDSATGQLLLGLAIGGAAAYVLSDEKLREKIIRHGVETFGALAGSLAELKEQVADIQAETMAERTSE